MSSLSFIQIVSLVCVSGIEISAVLHCEIFNINLPICLYLRLGRPERCSTFCSLVSYKTYFSETASFFVNATVFNACEWEFSYALKLLFLPIMFVCLLLYVNLFLLLYVIYFHLLHFLY